MENIETEQVTPKNEHDAHAAQLYKVILEMADEVNKGEQQLINEYKHRVKSLYRLNPDILEVIAGFSKDELENGDPNTIRKLVKEYSVNDVTDDFDIDIYREDLVAVLILAANLAEVKESAKKIRKDIKAGIKEYLNYGSSTSLRAAKLAQLEKFKKLNEEETDPDQKEKNAKKISIMEKSLSFSFLKDRTESLGEKEIKSIKDQFFDDELSNYVVRRFNDKIKKFGFKNTNVLSHFLSIEEKLLEEKYHPFNNIFLFTYMRYVSHADVYNKEDAMNVRSLTTSLNSLIYHNGESEDEDYIKNFIMSVDDLFMPYVEEFKEKNITYEFNPKMIQLRKDAVEKHINVLLGNLDVMGIDHSELDTSDLSKVKEFYNEKMKELMNKNLKPLMENNKSVDKLEVSDEESNKVLEELKNTLHEETNNEE
jgi:hypothetical protein